MILDRPPPEWKRPSMTADVRQAVLRAQDRKCKISGAPLEKGGFAYDHRPPLHDRKFDTVKWDTIPAANDPKFIQAIINGEHRFLTSGRRGDKKVSSRLGDVGRMRHDDRVREKHEAFLERQASKRRGKKLDKRVRDLHETRRQWPTRKIKSRGFAPYVRKRDRRKPRGENATPSPNPS